MRRWARFATAGAIAVAIPAYAAAAGPATRTTAYVLVGGPPLAAASPADPQAATLGRLRRVAGLDVHPDGSIVVADRRSAKVLVIDPSGRLRVLAGSGRRGFAGDGGPAPRARLRDPRDVAVTRDGGVLIADTGNHRIRYVGPGGRIRTVAGGRRGASRLADGGPARRAQLRRPASVAALPGGGFLVADSGNDRVRAVSPDGRIGTVAGSVRGFAGDGGPARRAHLRSPQGVEAAPGGGFVVADTGNGRVRIVSADGHISTLAGGGRAYPTGGRATRAVLGRPTAIARDGRHGWLIVDAGRARSGLGSAVRRVTSRGNLSVVLSEEDPSPVVVGALGPLSPVGLAVHPRTGLLVADRAEQRVVLVNRSPPRRLATRYVGRRLYSRTGDRLAASVVSTREADVDARLLRDGHEIARVRTRVPPGKSRIALLDRAQEGEYRAELVARAGRRIFTDAAEVLVVDEEAVIGPDR